MGLMVGSGKVCVWKKKGPIIEGLVPPDGVSVWDHIFFQHNCAETTAYKSCAKLRAFKWTKFKKQNSK